VPSAQAGGLQVRIKLSHRDFVLVILCPAVWAFPRQIFLASSFHELVPAPQAHLVAALAVIDCLVCGIQLIRAQWATVFIVHDVDANFVLTGWEG